MVLFANAESALAALKGKVETISIAKATLQEESTPLVSWFCISVLLVNDANMQHHRIYDIEKWNIMSIQQDKQLFWNLLVSNRFSSMSQRKLQVLVTLFATQLNVWPDFLNHIVSLESSNLLLCLEMIETTISEFTVSPNLPWKRVQDLTRLVADNLESICAIVCRRLENRLKLSHQEHDPCTAKSIEILMLLMGCDFFYTSPYIIPCIDILFGLCAISEPNTSIEALSAIEEFVGRRYVPVLQISITTTQKIMQLLPVLISNFESLDPIFIEKLIEILSLFAQNHLARIANLDFPMLDFLSVLYQISSLQKHEMLVKCGSVWELVISTLGNHAMYKDAYFTIFPQLCFDKHY